MTVGAINFLATACNGSGSMYQPFLVLIRNGSVAVVVIDWIRGRLLSSSVNPLHSTNQPDSEPILNGVGGGEFDSTMTCVIGNESGSILA